MRRLVMLALAGVALTASMPSFAAKPKLVPVTVEPRTAPPPPASPC